MKVLSLFDGIATAKQAFKNLGIECQYFASEIDKYSIKVASKNFPDIVQLGNVQAVGKLSHLDLVIGGSPCQDLSIAGKRAGLDGARSSLFFEFVRIVEESRPGYFVLENVASMKKQWQDLISSQLWEIEPQMINAALVSAQQRRRLFWIGKRQGDHYIQVDVGLPHDQGILLKDILENGESWIDKSHCLTATYAHGPYLKNTLERKQRTLIACVAKRGRYADTGNRFKKTTGKLEQFLEARPDGKTNSLTTVQKDNMVAEPVRVGAVGKGGQGNRVYSTSGKSVCLSANGGGQGGKSGLYAIPQNEYEVKNGLISFKDKTYPIKLPDGRYNIRKLTPIECERLQSLPDNFTAGISMTQRYKALGNGFNCAVIEHILSKLFLERK